MRGEIKWQPNDGSMGSTVYLLILMQHVVPELGLAEVIVVATGKSATPPPPSGSQRTLVGTFLIPCVV